MAGGVVRGGVDDADNRLGQILGVETGRGQEGAADELRQAVVAVIGAFGTGTFSSTSNLGFAEANAVGVMVILGVGILLLQLYFRRRMVEL